MSIRYIQRDLNIKKDKAMNRKVERGYPSLFNEVDKLVKRARRTNLEGLAGRYSHGTQLREALERLIHAWDRAQAGKEAEDGTKPS